MRHINKYLFAFGLVTLWAAFAWLYAGAEDGSSGLGLLGWIHMAFMLPGMFVISAFRSSYSNGDMPLAVMASFFVYAMVAMLAVQCIALFDRRE